MSTALLQFFLLRCCFKRQNCKRHDNCLIINNIFFCTEHQKLHQADKFLPFLVFTKPGFMETIIVQDTDQAVLEMLTIALEMGQFRGLPPDGFRRRFYGHD